MPSTEIGKQESAPTNKIARYNALWPLGTSDLQIEMACIVKGGKWEKNGKKQGNGLAFHYNAMRGILWPHLDDHRWNQLCLKEAVESKILVIMGPGSCVAGHTRILNPITGEQPTIQSLCEQGINPTVMTLDGPMVAGVPFVKGKEMLYEVVLGNGKRFTSTGGHRVLTPSGYRRVEELKSGQEILTYGNSRQHGKCASYHSIPEKDAPCFPRKAEDFPVNYSEDQFSRCACEYRSTGTTIVSINPIEINTFYDIQVPEAHHYFAEGAIHHNSGKTHFAAWFGLCYYYCFPNETLVMVSSTDLRGLQLRVFGEIKSLHEIAQSNYDVPGNLLETKCAISTDDIEEDLVRDLRRGLIGIPTVSNGHNEGLKKWIGCKQKRILLIADECQFMNGSFLSAFANLDKNVSFKAICLGNPSDILDPLGKAAEPKDGWGSHMEPETTSVWDTRFMSGRCVNLIGNNSPNFDYPENEPARFPYLISREKIANTKAFFSEDSAEYHSQCIGSMKVGTMLKRVLTRDLCVQFHAMSREVVWDGKPKRIGGLDAAYGGDRCMCGHLEFGKTTGGKMMLLLHPPAIVPIKVSAGKDPEEQIAEWVRDYCRRTEIRPEDFFHDSTGRGSLGTALARVWSAQCNPVEFGGTPTTRPVSLDLFIWDYATKRRRLKRCDEHYSKFVTELWFTIRYAIEAGQIRGLPEEMMEELCMREWSKVKGDKIEIESKVEMKERVGRSPDIADLCFEKGTMILTPTGNVPIQQLKPGDLVVTPFGNTQIFSTQKSPCLEFSTLHFDDGSELRGRVGHRIFTWDCGWVRMDSLSIDNYVESAHNLWIWQILNASFTRVEHTVFKHLADIIRTRTGAVLQKDFYTDLSGRNIMAQFLKACASTTSTAIGRITGFAICKCRRLRSTLLTIAERIGRSLKPLRRCLLDWLMPSCALQNGTVLKKVEYGTLKLQSELGQSAKEQRSAYVRSVERFISCTQEEEPVGAIRSAPINVSRKEPDSGVLPTLESVLCAAKVLWLGSTVRHKLALLNAEHTSLQEPEDVYNLTLVNHNVYYANGVLVENCSILLEGARQRGFSVSKLGNAEQEQRDNQWLKDLARSATTHTAHELVYG